MSSDGSDTATPSDAFTNMWTDWMSGMGSAGFAAPTPNPSEEGVKKMRQAFFDAWAQQCDEFMRSEAFLDNMKKSMDGALAFREQLNEFLTKSLHEKQMPARDDIDAIQMGLRNFQDSVMTKLEELSQRVERIETGAGKTGGTPKKTKSTKTLSSSSNRAQSKTRRSKAAGKKVANRKKTR